MASSIEKITGISIKSPFFSANPTLEFFPAAKKAPNRVALVFGTNGSGKSTIAQGFREYVNNQPNPEICLELMAEQTPNPMPADERAKKIFVFDEKYVDQSVKIQSSGLNAIVLFGEQIEIADKIKKLNDDLQQLRLEAAQKQETLDKFAGKDDVNSPKFWSRAIKNALNSTGGWAEVRGITIQQRAESARISVITIDRLGKLVPRSPQADTQAQFEQLYSAISQTDGDSAAISARIEPIGFDENLEARAAARLEHIPTQPKLSQRESELLERFVVGTISAAKDFLLDGSNTFCPHCLQPVTDAYRVNALEQIEHILDRELDDFLQELQGLIAPAISAESYQQFSLLDQTTYENLLHKIGAYNAAADRHNRLLREKIGDPFTKIQYDAAIGLSAARAGLNDALNRLEDNRLIYNRVIEDRKKSIRDLDKLNDERAHYAIEKDYASLVKQKAAEQYAADALRTVTEAIETIEQECDALEAQRRDIRVAAEQINQSLEYIFCTKGRLELELGPNQLYLLKSRGQFVTPESISIGERNALALCYFFTEIAKDANPGSLYATESLLVIDDPISSFDFENRIGILSFLRLKMEQILKACETTKILISTHDISVLLDLDKTIDDLSRLHNLAVGVQVFQLANKALTSLRDNRKFLYNEYTALLERIYAFANNPTPEYGLVIGNMIRRVLEAFSTFSYKKGIVDISLDPKVLDLLPNEASRHYFRNSMYRLVLHGESHFEDAMRYAPETSFFARLSDREKQRTARDVLCFLYKVNPLHIQRHLPDAQDDLDAWWAKIESTATSL